MKLVNLSKDQQDDLISSFWTMLMELENQALNNDGDKILRMWVEQWYDQWNSIRGTNLKPRWKTDCHHNWLDIRNDIIKDGEWCNKCNAVRPGNLTTVSREAK